MNDHERELDVHEHKPMLSFLRPPFPPLIICCCCKFLKALMGSDQNNITRLSEFVKLYF